MVSTLAAQEVRAELGRIQTPNIELEQAMEQITAQTTAIEVSLEEQLKSLIQSEDLVAELSASQLALVGGGGGIASFD